MYRGHDFGSIPISVSTIYRILISVSSIFFVTTLLFPFFLSLPIFSTTATTLHSSSFIATPFQNDLHLSTQQCNAIYPDLYHEPNRARDWYVQRGGITKEQLEEATGESNARIAIINNQLYIKQFNNGINSRTRACLASLQQILITSPEALPDVEFVIQTNDAGDGDLPAFALSRTTSQPNLFLLPDFGFFAWPEPLGPGFASYNQVRKRTEEREWELAGLVASSGLAGRVREGVAGKRIEEGEPFSWDAKIPKLLWRGVPMVEIRHDLLRASEDKPWSSVLPIDWGNLQEGTLKTPSEHCDWKFLAQVEGWAYSGRLKYLQNCKSVIITHPLKYIQHYHHLFNTDPSSPDQNMVQVALPLTEHLEGVMEELLRDDARSERIASNSWEMFKERYLSPAAIHCYYRHAIRAYADVQNYIPVITNETVSYEGFMLTGSTGWNPHR